MSPPASNAEVEKIARADAVGKAFEAGSVIDQVQKLKLKARRARPLGSLVWRGSEMIGPSIAYAHTALQVAEHLCREKSDPTGGDRSMEILELFSGSGYCSRRLAARSVAWLVYCVDNAISSEDAGVDEVPNILWLKMDAALVGKGRVLDQHFDLVCADPPHGDLFEIAFCEQDETEHSLRQAGLLKTIKRITNWLVLYPGHLSQLGRATVICEAIADDEWKSQLVQVGPDVVIVASKEKGFEEAMKTIVDDIRADPFIKALISAYGWNVKPCF